MWIEVEKACRPPAPPDEWRKKQPTEAEIRKFQLPFIIAAADKAKNYYTKYPKENMVPTAKAREYQMLNMAYNAGATNLVTRIAALEKDRLADPKISNDERFQTRRLILDRAVASKESQGFPAMMAELEKGIRELQKDFPKRPEIFDLLLQLAGNCDGEKCKSLLQEIISGATVSEVKETAKGLLKKMDMVGKPIQLKFAAVDGRNVDVSKLAGKVVLVDFWATWCGPCVAELPHVKEAYEKLHGKGFEVVGISLDQKKDALQKFVSSQKMEWPQYFDGFGWTNKLAKEFSIESIPAMWLIDKKGVLRDVNARNGLSGKIEKLLAE